MANANAIVDKMVGLGLRHGEKLGMALASMAFFACVAMAVSVPVIDTTPEKIKQAAQASDSNLNRHEERDAIVKRLEEGDAHITNTEFAKTVAEQLKFRLVADNYKPAREWVTPEPGAGLIRDEPKLVAPDSLFAYPGRGGMLVFALDEQGKRIPDTDADKEEEEPERKGNLHKKKKGGGMMGGGGMGMMGGGMMGGQKKKKHKKSKAEIEREEKEEREREARRKTGGLVGGTLADTKETKPETETEDEGGPFKEVTKGYRWVALTGTLNHGQILDNYRAALKNPAIALPNYARLDLQRKVLQPDGSWGDWQDVDTDKNLTILDNIPERDDEYAPENVRPDMLVDPLPFLKAGLWEKVHIASLVPREKVEVKEEPKTRMGGGYGMMGGGSEMMGAMMQQQQKAMMGMQQMQAQQGDMMGSMMGSEMMGGAEGGMMGATETVGNFWKSKEKTVMIRALDFTVEPDTTYRYRVRVVVFNPNHDREDVSPGTNTKSKVLTGPWSKETDEVAMPADVAPYVLSTEDNALKIKKAHFQVVRFHPMDGVTVPRGFDAGVGDLVGEFRTAAVPVSDGTGAKTEPINFTSHKLVMDINGGGSALVLPAGLVGSPITQPAVVALLNPDGSISMRQQFEDSANDVRKDIAANYNREIAESDKERQKSSKKHKGMGGAMGQMMGRGR